MNIIFPKKEDIPACAEVYISAFGEEPWCEEYKTADAEKYISSYLDSKTKFCFAAKEDGKIIGVALCMLVPSIDSPFLRIEDFCVSGKEQGRGAGTEFMRLIEKEAEKLGCDCIMLGTQRNFPSHKFYLKNGFNEIDSVLMYKEL